MTFDVYKAKERSPIIYLLSPMDNKNEIIGEIKTRTDKAFSLVFINSGHWNEDFSPYPYAEFSGGANIFLKNLLDRIPEIEKGIDIQFRILSGYSLSALFSIYAVLHSDAFKCIASQSASLWYPDFIDYLKSHKISKNLEYAYFSLGDKEKHTTNTLLSKVEDKTKEAEIIFRENGIKTKFELNKGNHYKAVNTRIAKGIAWLLGQ